jgi:hypothetical protein
MMAGQIRQRMIERTAVLLAKKGLQGKRCTDPTSLVMPTRS